MRLTEREAAALGLPGAQRRPRKPPGLRLPDLPGPPGLAFVTERQVQRGIRATGFQALPPGTKIPHYPNERRVADLPDAEQKTHLGLLIGDGMEVGASDLLFIWDAARGKPGNRGMCWVECKKPVKALPISAKQLEWMYDLRSIGIVAGWAQCWDHAEALLAEAGAPLRFIDRDNQTPPWWRVLGALPPLYGDPPGAVRFPTGAVLRGSKAP